MTSLKEPAVLPNKMGGGPHGLGDPYDTTLRKVEREVMIPKIMRDKARTEKCPQEVEEFSKCCKDYSIFMVVTCRQQNSALKDCLGRWYENDEFKNECKNIYLAERKEYRMTGIPKKHRIDKL